MHNSLKHADATIVDLKLSIVENKLIVVVQDDGIGFNAALVQNGNGLRNMQERLLNVNGQLMIEANNGTKISMEIPLV